MSRRTKLAIVWFMIGSVFGGMATATPGGALSLGLLGAIGGSVFGGRTKRGPAQVPAPPPRSPAASRAAPPRPDGPVASDDPAALLVEGFRRGILDASTYDAMRSLLVERRGAPRPTVAAGAGATTIPVPSPVVVAPVRPIPTAEPSVGEVPIVAPSGATPAATPPEGPSPFQRRLGALRDLIASDLAVHGLTYLGVLLVFAGAFGFVLFSFGSVQVGLRPIAELAAPAVLLASARYLRRRGAPFVATALGLLGGVLLPIFLFASFVDGVPIPPDLSGWALIAGLVAVSLAVAAGYAWYATRVPDASVRYLIAPAIWLAVWSAGLVTAELPSSGYSLRHWSATQLAIVSVAVALTAVIVRVFPRIRFADAIRTSVVPGIAVTYVLVVSLAAGEGWPTVPLVIAGISLFAVSETIGLPDRIAQVAQPLIAGATIVPLAPAIGESWAGVVGVLAFVTLLERFARRDLDAVGAVACGTGVAVSLVACSLDPWAMIAGFGLASMWAHVRRVRPLGLPQVSDLTGVAAAVLPAGAAAGLALALPDEIAISIVAAATVAASAFARLRRPSDRFLAWWAAAAAAAVSVVSTAPTLDPAAAAATAGFAAIAFVLAPAPAWVRGWGGMAAASWAGWLGATVLGVGSSGRALSTAVLGATAVIVSGVGRRTPDDLLPHLGGAGLIAAGVTLVLPATGWARTGVIGCWVVAAAAATAWSEARGAGPIGVLAGRFERSGLRRAVVVARAAPIVGVAVGAPFLVVGVAEGIGLTEGRRSWNGFLVAATGVVEALAARALATRRSAVAAVAAVAAFFTTLVGISLAAPDPWPTILALLAPVSATFVLGGELRRPAMTWIAWLAAAALTVLLAERAGVAPPDLWIAAFAWAVIALAGGLAVDDLRAGRRAPDEAIRLAWLRPPIALGALALPASLAFAFRGSPEWYGSWSLVAVVVYLIVAVQLRAGAIVAASAALATVTYASFLPISPWVEPVLFVPWSALLVGVAIAARRATSAPDPWVRWDGGILVVAHGVAILALTRSATLGELAPTWAAFGALSVMVSIVLRRPEWAGAAAVLLIVAAADAGPGWLALALASSSVACGLAASRTAGRTRWGMQLAAAVFAAASWNRFLVWAEWPTPRAIVTTAVLGVALLLVPAVLVKVGRLALDWAAALAGLGLVAVAAAAIEARVLGSGMTARQAGVVATVAIAAVGLALGVSASRVRLPGQRETAAFAGVFAAVQLGVALNVTPTAGAAIAAATGLLAVLAWIALLRSRVASPWLPSLGLVAVSADVLALALSIDALPRRDVLEAALVLTGVEFAVAGVALRRPHLIAPAPVFICAAWFVFASDAFRGELQWFTVPAGIALLSVVSIERRANRLLERTPMPEAMLLAEYLGMALVVGVALVETLSIGPARGLIAIAGGTGLAVWGALTRVRRRAVFGVATVVTAVVLMLAGPIARLVPQVRGPALWGLIVVAGILLLIAATMLERGRAKVAVLIRRLDTLMEGWE